MSEVDNNLIHYILISYGIPNSKIDEHMRKDPHVDFNHYKKTKDLYRRMKIYIENFGQGDIYYQKLSDYIINGGIGGW